MKFIYFGSSEFSKVILDNLCLKGYRPSLIVSKPDKPKGRGLNILPTPISSFAKSKDIRCLKPTSLSDEALREELNEIAAELFIVVDYGGILPDYILSLPKIFSLCLHPSLLPRYRGAAPIETALINGETNTGLTTFKINEQIDAGDIILQEEVVINDNDDFLSLRRKLVEQGGPVLIKTIKSIEANRYTLSPQDEKKATLTRRLKKENGRINWNCPAQNIRNLIRATLLWPSAYTYYQGLMIKVLKAQVIKGDSKNKPGTIAAVEKEGLDVCTAQDILRIRKLKPEGKKEMESWSFVCGQRVKIGQEFK